MFRYLRAAFRFVTDGAYRSVWMLRLLKPRNLFQANNMTWQDRYPVLFQRLRDILGDGTEVRLLSFGCSTGEEVFTLRKYFPNASIKGIDINSHNINVCQKRLREYPDPKIGFEAADTVQGEPIGEYDAILCMAVFRRGDLLDPRFTRCDRLIRFEDFCRMVNDIAQRLKPGGLFLIAHSNFRFRDTPTASEFDLVLRQNLTQATDYFTPIFDQENKRTSEINCDEVMFQKRQTV